MSFHRNITNRMVRIGEYTSMYHNNIHHIDKNLKRKVIDRVQPHNLDLIIYTMGLLFQNIDSTQRF